MGIRIMCVCGKDVVAPDELAGKKGKCPHCGRILRIPSQPPIPHEAAHPAPDAGAIHFTCPCGKKLTAPSESAGKQANCTACGRRIWVPSVERALSPQRGPLSLPRRREPSPATAGKLAVLPEAGSRVSEHDSAARDGTAGTAPPPSTPGGSRKRFLTICAAAGIAVLLGSALLYSLGRARPSAANVAQNEADDRRTAPEGPTVAGQSAEVAQGSSEKPMAPESKAVPHDRAVPARKAQPLAPSAPAPKKADRIAATPARPAPPIPKTSTERAVDDGAAPPLPKEAVAPSTDATAKQPVALQQRRKPYRLHLGIQLNVIKLQVYGLMKENRQEGWIGAKADIPVANDLVVTGVPAEYIEGCVAHARILAQVRGLLPEKGSADRWQIACAFAQDWIIMREVELGISSQRGKEPKGRELVALDGKVESSLPASLRTWPSMAWLLNLGELDRGPGQLGPSRHGISFRTLLARFDPDAATTEQNADEVAEELVWTKSLGLSDGTWGKVADTRRLLQAALLHSLKFDVADPAWAQGPIGEAARKKLASARGEFMRVWAKPGSSVPGPQ